MRLWHKDLIDVLPNEQLLGQWRECCAIARNIKAKGTPNHLLINKIMDYPDIDFNTYAFLIHEEMRKRGYKAFISKFFQWRDTNEIKPDTKIFYGWHNKRYLMQCYRNLQEKYDCGGITKREHSKILTQVIDSLDNRF